MTRRKSNHHCYYFVRKICYNENPSPEIEMSFTNCYSKRAHVIISSSIHETIADLCYTKKKAIPRLMGLGDCRHYARVISSCRLCPGYTYRGHSNWDGNLYRIWTIADNRRGKIFTNSCLCERKLPTFMKHSCFSYQGLIFNQVHSQSFPRETDITGVMPHTHCRSVVRLCTVMNATPFHFAPISVQTCTNRKAVV